MSTSTVAIADAQMRTLIDAGAAHPQHDTVAAFMYYDGSWWVHATPDRAAAARAENACGVWLRADDDDLAVDSTFRHLPPAAA